MRKALIETDCVIEVHDARIPLSGRNLTFQHDIAGNKPHILVLNKKDLVFKKGSRYKETDIRQKILEQDGRLSEVIFTNCKDNRCKGLHSILPVASKLIGERERYHRSFCPDSNIIVVGIPNVGKSSLINLIRGGFLKVKSRPLKVGDKPGVTRALQTKIRVSDDPLIFLLDTPGIMMPNIKNLETGMKLSACATLRDENVGILNIADYILYQLNKNSMFDYVKVMGLDNPMDDVIEMLTSAAIAKGTYLDMSRKYVGEDGQVPDIIMQAVNFIAGFRSSNFGSMILDNDLLD